MVVEDQQQVHQLQRVEGSVVGSAELSVQNQGNVVQLYSDNMTAVAYISKQGGTVSKELYLLARQLLLWCRDNQVQVLCRHIPGKLNKRADELSRAGVGENILEQVWSTEWKLNRQVLQQVWLTLGKPLIDLFATHENHVLPLYFSPVVDLHSLGTDVLFHDWDGLDVYTFPPWNLLPQVVRKLERSTCRMQLVALRWPRRSWYPIQVAVYQRSSTVAQETRSTSSGNGSTSLVSRRGCFRVTRMDFMRAAYRSRGFSDKVIENLLASKQNSTMAMYQCRWDSFVKWTEQNKVNLDVVDVNHVAEFLIDKFEQGFSLSTIKGHLSVIVGTLETRGSVKIEALNPVFHSLMRSFIIARPIKLTSAPKWNLAMVLHALSRPPFEPMEKIPLKLLSWKTLFLVLLASAKRRAHVFHMDYAQLAFQENYMEVVIGVLPEFIAKTEVQLGRNIDHTVRIPALSEASEKEDRALCPVRALKKYVSVTKLHRRGRRRLFLPLQLDKEDFTATAITQWVKNLISLVYKDCPTAQADLFRAAHEIRGLATTWAALNSVALSSILKTAQWRNHNVFTARYLKDFTFVKEEMLVLGPLVVAEHVV
jgi:hypothetical protein